jgi:hypothetical protein
LATIYSIVFRLCNRELTKQQYKKHCKKNHYIIEFFIFHLQKKILI